MYNPVLFVLINSNNFLLKKHGFVFQDEQERAEIIDSIKDVDYTFIHHSDDQTNHNAIHYFQPHYFCKGGDRSSIDNLPSVEVEACLCYGTQIIFGVGGSDKVSSSSDLMKCVANHYLTQVPVKDWVNKIPRIINGYYPEKTIIYNIERLDEALDRCIDSKFY
jgi:D-beta-D-heptose 7-phosphate kinase/D-beta-D-heptose 1-phosphate adenosyltransferase